jgi:hypothetical protein
VSDINFNPYWKIPASIVARDIVPKYMEDPSYLEVNHIRVFDGVGGPEIDPLFIDFFRNGSLEKHETPAVFSILRNLDAIHRHADWNRQIKICRLAGGFLRMERSNHRGKNENAGKIRPRHRGGLSVV